MLTIPPVVGLNLVLDCGADGSAPVTTATPSVAPNSAGWYATDLTVTPASVDEAASGVASISYTINGGTPATVAGASASVPISTEGVTTLAYFATDTAGNAEAAQTLVLRLDKTAPALTCAASPKVLWPRNWRLAPVAVALQGADGGSGLAGAPVLAALSYQVRDRAGNRTSCVAEVKVPANRGRWHR